METLKKPRRGVNKERDFMSARTRGVDTSSAAGAMQVAVDHPLTTQQKLFVKYWAEGDTKGAAALRAGYNDESPGYRLCRQPNVLAEYQKVKDLYEVAAQTSREEVMEGFRDAIAMATLLSDPPSMIAGWREIGKMCGYYAPVEHKMKVDVSGNIVLDKMNSLSDAELLRIISQGAQHASTQLLTDETDGGETD